MTDIESSRILPVIKKISFDTSEDNIDEELYSPCLKWAERYDRGVGFFTSGWLEYNLVGMSDFASRGGKIRLIASPIISEKDYNALLQSVDVDSSKYEVFNNALEQNVDALAEEMKKDLFNAFAWMIHDGIIDIRFAIPTEKLEDGDFHDKFGIFYCGDDALSFSGSMNDSKKGFINYENIKVFMTWAGTGAYVSLDIDRFNKIWNKKDHNLSIYNLPEGVKDKIFRLRTDERPYKTSPKPENKWKHQDEAVEVFMREEHGILAMATGTGKTRTAIKIMNRLFDEGKILRVVICMAGNDLLEQWAIQMRDCFEDKPVYRQYSTYKELNQFSYALDDAILLISSDADNLSQLLTSMELWENCYNDTLFIFDEVHGMGSFTRIANLTGRIQVYKYRLGLSATPEREYDDAGNTFIENEIGPIIYTFGLEDAIKKGILCEFNYFPLPYNLTDEEREKKKKIIGAYNYRKKLGEPVSEKDLYMQLSAVNKTAEMKLDVFKDFLNANQSILKNCIIFVETKEYGARVQEILLEYIDKYHTYYDDDAKINLENFAQGNLDCLLTCKKVSEGIDISRVTNIVLFSSDRSKLVTTQRIGRALRIDNTNPQKVANVIDFIIETDSQDENNADADRCEWLTNLSKVRHE